MDVHDEVHSEQEAGAAERRGIGTLGGAALGVLATVVLGLAFFGAVTIAGRSAGFARAQTPDNGQGMMRSMSGGGSGGDMQSMTGMDQGMANMDEMVKLCTQHMQEMSAMMRIMTAQPGATPSP